MLTTEVLITANGIDLWVEIHGDDDGVPVLLISGSDATTLRWPASLISSLEAERCRVITFDNRDCGASTKIDPDHPYRLDAMAADASAVLDAVGAPSAHIVGYSMGGAIAQLVALDRPEQARSLTLVATTPGLGDERLPFAQDWFIEAMSERLFAPPPATHDDKVAWQIELYRMLAGTRFGFDEEVQRRLAEAEIARCWYPDSGHGVAAGASPTRVDRLGEIAVPTTVVHGTADPVFSLDHAHTLVSGIAGAHLELIEGLGHEVPEGFGAALAEIVLAQIRAR